MKIKSIRSKMKNVYSVLKVKYQMKISQNALILKIEFQQGLS